MQMRTRLQPALVIAALLLLWPAAALAEHRNVLVLHSYHKGFTWTDSVQQGAESALEQSSLPLEIDVEYMDAKRHNVQTYFNELAGYFEAKYAQHQPGVILSCDDDALEFLFEYRNQLFPGVPVVFCGLNADGYDPAMLQGRSGYTGVVERLDFRSTIDLITSMQPQTQRIAFVHDRTTSGQMDRQTIEHLAPEFAGDLEFVFPDTGGGLSEDELLEYLAGLQEDTVVFFMGFFLDKNGAHLPLEYIIPRISQAAPVPVYTLAEAYLGHGVLGGKLLSAEAHGAAAGEKALRLLQGTAVSEEPVFVGSSNRYMFDYRQLQRFPRLQSRIPDGSIVAYAPTSLLEKHRTAIGWGAAGALLLVIFTIMLMVNTLRLRRAERRLSAKERQYRLLAENATDLITTHDAEGVFIYVSPMSEQLTGYTPEEMLGRNVYAFFHPDDIPYIKQRHEQLLLEDTTVALTYRFKIKNGAWLWMESIAKSMRSPAPDLAPCREPSLVLKIISVTRDVTERKRAEEAMHKYNDMLATAERLANVGSWELDIANGVSRFSENWASIHGFPSMTATFSELRPVAHPDDLPMLETALHEATQGAPYDVVHRIIRQDTGEVRWVQALGFLVRDDKGKPLQLRGAAQDVTERKQLEQHLRQYERIVSQPMDLIALFDKEHRYSLVNATYAEYFGKKPKELQGRPMGEFIGWDMYEKLVKLHLNSVLAGEGLVHNRWQDYPAAGRRFISVRLTPDKDDDGQVHGVIAIIRDITDIKAAQDMKEEVERIMRHDLKAPLAGLALLPDMLLQDDNLNSRQRDYLGHIKKRCEDLLRMVDISMDILRMEQGSYVCRPRPFDLLPVLRRNLEDNEILIHDKELKVQWSCGGVEGEPPPLATVLGEELLAYALFGNLIKNAVEASPVDGVLRLELDCGNDFCTVQLHNQGDLPAEMHGRVFEKYATFGKTHGAGLGTYSAKLMATAQGWDIGLRHAQGEGVTITVRMPVTASLPAAN